MTTALLIASPKPFIILHDLTNLHQFIWLADYRLKHRKNKAQLLPIDRQGTLKFSSVESPCAIRSEHDALGGLKYAITGKGLVQLMECLAVCMAPTNEGRLKFSPKDVTQFFEDDEQRTAYDFLDKQLPLMLEPDRKAAPDDPHGHAASHARKINGATWQGLGVMPLDEPLPEAKPLPFDGKYNIFEMAEHDRQTGLLQREMAAVLASKT